MHLYAILFADIDAPISQVGKNVDIDQSQVDTLVSFGFHEDLARKALKASVWYTDCFYFVSCFWEVYKYHDFNSLLGAFHLLNT